ncbi:hypothetical protein LEP1GSC064_1357 [Leptospira kirschneri serovar Grippotyphosa str. Moskva]|nr:hypothetical protein LEP1GSC044_3794 [Leptospira kirschneri serovar Grippotyphosa str. RM52]EKP05683.1 hypothetical protein LEP1GSC018_0818 [Leptospira kirschneri str. 2008720114]EKQ84496.1 hypothetical protein LEP1GSC064_1357 [Leptospira kirschneri serovar Grippotyphosa str. Moskva]
MIGFRPKIRSNWNKFPRAVSLLQNIDIIYELLKSEIISKFQRDLY